VSLLNVEVQENYTVSENDFCFRLHVNTGKRTENLLVGPPGWCGLRPEDGSKIQLPKPCKFMKFNDLDGEQSAEEQFYPS
jgi:hypothetical protein